MSAYHYVGTYDGPMIVWDHRTGHSYSVCDWSEGFSTDQPYDSDHALLVPAPNPYSPNPEEWELTPREKVGLHFENNESAMSALRGRTNRQSYDWSRQWTERAVG